ncbi:hypothetical protein P154DRAFT_534667 [Amniculicola lignicola CBS 123094]|uniref:Uncharacterized protein n=1 Tax=Amniculicola lignicola CBS 123094 TaxID=1392246 RepID=A0A6A5WH90_9PLEO|nr:hypothetical protein P154DRAFT_534667 [Amniculicola lignicola CBS 123094]
MAKSLDVRWQGVHTRSRGRHGIRSVSTRVARHSVARAGVAALGYGGSGMAGCSPDAGGSAEATDAGGTHVRAKQKASRTWAGFSRRCAARVWRAKGRGDNAKTATSAYEHHSALL